MEKNDTPKGILDPAGAPRRFHLRRYPAPARLARHVENVWIVEWDLRGQPEQVQRVLPYPNAHLAFEAGQTALHGIVAGPFDKRLAGQGKVLGLRFRPGGLRPLVKVPVATFTGRVVALEEAFGLETGEIGRAHV